MHQVDWRPERSSIVAEWMTIKKEIQQRKQQHHMCVRVRLQNANRFETFDRVSCYAIFTSIHFSMTTMHTYTRARARTHMHKQNRNRNRHHHQPDRFAYHEIATQFFIFHTFDKQWRRWRRRRRRRHTNKSFETIIGGGGGVTDTLIIILWLIFSINLKFHNQTTKINQIRRRINRIFVVVLLQLFIYVRKVWMKTEKHNQFDKIENKINFIRFTG